MTNLREALKLRPDKYCAICLDIFGPFIRTGRHKDDLPIKLKKGDILEIYADEDIEGEGLKIGCSY